MPQETVEVFRLTAEEVEAMLSMASDHDAAEFAVREVIQNTSQHGNGLLRCHQVSSTVYVWNNIVEETGLPCAGLGLSMLQGITSRQVGSKWVAAIHLDRCCFQGLDLEALLSA